MKTLLALLLATAASAAIPAESKAVQLTDAQMAVVVGGGIPDHADAGKRGQSMVEAHARAGEHAAEILASLIDGVNRITQAIFR